MNDMEHEDLISSYATYVTNRRREGWSLITSAPHSFPIQILFIAITAILLPFSAIAETKCDQFNQMLVDGLCLEQSELLDSIAIPYTQSGKIVGIRLFRIKPDSILEKRKFKNGDVLLRLNGQAAPDLKLPQLIAQLGLSKEKCTAEIRRMASEEMLDCTLE